MENNIVKNQLDLIFSDLQTPKFNFNKKIKIFDRKKEADLPINIYLYLFIQSLNLLDGDVKILDLFNNYLQTKINPNWLENNIDIKKLIVGFRKDNEIILLESLENEIDMIFEMDGFSDAVLEYCENILKQTKSYFLVVKYLRLQYQEFHMGHAAILLFMKNGNDLEIFFYDPNGSENSFKEYSDLFLNYLKEALEMGNENKIYFSKIKIINTDNDIFKKGLQKITEARINDFQLKSPGYCILFSLFFLYCFISIVEKYNFNCNFDIINYIQIYFIERFSTYTNNEIYYTVVSFANKLKDIFFNTRKNSDFLQTLNSQIINLYLKKEQLKSLDVTNYLPEDDTYIFFNELKNSERRNYDEELKLLNWNNIKEKRENEYCKLNNQCISKLCVKNKCTKPTPNDKLDFLTRLEWKKEKLQLLNLQDEFKNNITEDFLKIDENSFYCVDFFSSVSNKLIKYFTDNVTVTRGVYYEGYEWDFFSDIRKIIEKTINLIFFEKEEFFIKLNFVVYEKYERNNTEIINYNQNTDNYKIVICLGSKTQINYENKIINLQDGGIFITRGNFSRKIEKPCINLIFENKNNLYEDYFYND